MGGTAYYRHWLWFESQSKRWVGTCKTKRTGSNYQWLKEKRRKEFEFSNPIHLSTIWDFKCCFVWTNPFFPLWPWWVNFCRKQSPKVRKGSTWSSVGIKVAWTHLYQPCLLGRKVFLFCACPFVGFCYEATTRCCAIILLFPILTRSYSIDCWLRTKTN